MATQDSLYSFTLYISLESCKFWRPFRGSWHWVSVIVLQLRFVLFAAAEMTITPTDEGLTKMVEVPNRTVVHAAICWCFLLLLLWDLLRCSRWLLKFISELYTFQGNFIFSYYSWRLQKVGRIALAPSFRHSSFSRFFMRMQMKTPVKRPFP